MEKIGVNNLLWKVGCLIPQADALKKAVREGDDSQAFLWQGSAQV